MAVESLLAALFALGCATPAATGAASTAVGGAQLECLEGEPWPEADRLFLQDPRWRGGDAAYSVDLGGERSLWLFGDSFVASKYVNRRAGLGMVRNSVAVMRGRDPSRAAITFYAGRTADGAPAAFFPLRENRWFWPAHGVRDGNVLWLFMYRMAPNAGEAAGFDFRFEGTEVVRVSNPDAEPPEWQMEWLALDASVPNLAVGASVLVEDDAVYAYAVQPAPPHDVYLLRWPRAALQAATLPAPEAWTGSGFEHAPPVAVLKEAALELSAHRDPTTREIVLVHSQGFGPAPVVAHRAPRPEGPFGAAVPLFRPSVKPLELTYAGKAHPQLQGASSVLTYVVNSTDGGAVLWDERIYYPRFVKVTPGRCAAPAMAH